MTASDTNAINILDLPDEMLHAIFNKLNMTDMLYSLVGVHQRFDRLVLDPLLINHLVFVTKQSDIHNSWVNMHVLDRIREEILPRINEIVNKLTVDTFSMKHVFGAIHYPQLYSLAFVNYQSDIFVRHLSDNTLLRHLEQITHLTVDIYSEKAGSFDGNDPCIFELVLLCCKRLIDLTFFHKSSRTYLPILPLNIPFTSYIISKLTKLTINLNSFDDCLYLLNACIESLSTLIIRIKRILRSSSEIDNKKQLVKLKCFSLTTDWYTYYYDKQVVPLLRRMLNLEELMLHLSVIRTGSAYIDGNQLYDEVLKYMPRLNKFIFHIHTHLNNYFIRTNVPSNDDIRNSFIKREFQSVNICADEKLTYGMGNCHIYSLPYYFEDFLFMSSCFQGGRFNKVRMVLLLDRLPFEHKLFKIISQGFPFLQKLTIVNYEPQTNEQQHLSTLITFKHLFELNIREVHTDYVIQLLSDRKTRLPRLTNLVIEYKKLVVVTNNFTNDMTRLNCAKIKSLITHKTFVRSQNFNSYFPCL
ncbi:unnamed protein product [Rotaria socialis]|uniref:F-box domain-containing protein n=1 Tax=Rotaria socialis TaxID=392032 RepID=A0A818BFX2_9BILA|nr:unnamed protein product [Rotaria socialis]CAF3418471.1 unnamed protein product [Rotaria socialis]CAF3682607.1 unnamed protein product [Rotaria socialis]CAF3782750.1 unnamed protein product [Rotaria socialis]